MTTLTATIDRPTNANADELARWLALAIRTYVCEGGIVTCKGGVVSWVEKGDGWEGVYRIEGVGAPATRYSAAAAAEVIRQNLHNGFPQALLAVRNVAE